MQTFTTAFRDLDRLLRGDATRLNALQQGRIEIDAGRLPGLILLLGVLYGACMGCFALANQEIVPALLQTLSTMGKVPILFGATLLVTFPSLYIFNALVGSRLTLLAVWQLLVSSLTVMLAILASLGPIIAFFSLSTRNYPFMLLLNVVFFAVSGFLGLKFLLHTLHRLTVVLYESGENAPSVSIEKSASDAAPSLQDGALAKLENRAMSANVRQIFSFWVVIFALVGMQMSWVLRPFVWAPGTPFRVFTQPDSNFYAAVWQSVMRLFGG